MPITKLELWDKRQADEVREMLRQKLPGARIEEGTHDALGGSIDPDKHLLIDYHDQYMVEHALEEHFAARGHSWREFKRD